MWKIKVLIQFLLAHLPKAENLNYLLQILNKSLSPEKIAKRIPVLLKQMRFLEEFLSLEGISVLEAGTGWNAISAILFYLMGARIIYTYDLLPHVRYRLVQNVIYELEKQIEQIHLITCRPKFLVINRLKRLKDSSDIETMLNSANIIYKAPADVTRTGLPDNSIDLVYTNAVLEHLPESSIHGLMVEVKRILKKQGVVYHLIGLGDHYASFDKNISTINFLQYPEWLWRIFAKNKISYHNRLREKQFLEIFESHGIKIKKVNSKTDPHDLEILKTIRVDKHFSGMKDEELAVYKSEVILSY